MSQAGTVNNSGSSSGDITSIRVDIDTTLDDPGAGGGTVTAISKLIRMRGDNGIVTLTDSTNYPNLDVIAFSTGTATTDDLNQTQDLLTFAVPDDSTLTFQVLAVAQGDDGNFLSQYFTSAVYNIGGTAAFYGNVKQFENVKKTSTMWGQANIYQVVSGANYILRVTGQAGITINWKAIVPGSVISEAV